VYGRLDDTLIIEIHLKTRKEKKNFRMECLDVLSNLRLEEVSSEGKIACFKNANEWYN